MSGSSKVLGHSVCRDVYFRASETRSVLEKPAEFFATEINQLLSQNSLSIG